MIPVRAIYNPGWKAASRLGRTVKWSKLNQSRGKRRRLQGSKGKEEEENVDTSSIGQSILSRVSMSAQFSNPRFSSLQPSFSFLFSSFPFHLHCLASFSSLIIPFHSTPRRSCSRNVGGRLLLTCLTYIRTYVRTLRK